MTSIFRMRGGEVEELSAAEVAEVEAEQTAGQAKTDAIALRQPALDAEPSLEEIIDALLAVVTDPTLVDIKARRAAAQTARDEIKAL